jgi:hypothetical protein
LSKLSKANAKPFFERFGSFRDVVSNNKILYATRFWVIWAFLIALEAIRKAQFTQKLVA